MNKIKEYLERYEDLWHEISSTESLLPCMDLAMDKIDENNYYGFDFSGDKSVYMLFFTGASNYFPAICNCTDENNMDACPIYIFNLASNKPSEYIGNFKEYMTILLNGFIQEEDSEEAKMALRDLGTFTDRVINKVYRIHINN